MVTDGCNMQTLKDKINIALFEASRLNNVGDQTGVAFWIEELGNILSSNKKEQKKTIENSLALEEGNFHA